MVRAYFPQGNNSSVVANTNFPPQSGTENTAIASFFEAFENISDGSGRILYDNIPDGQGSVLIEEPE